MKYLIFNTQFTNRNVIDGYLVVEDAELFMSVLNKAIEHLNKSMFTAGIFPLRSQKLSVIGFCDSQHTDDDRLSVIVDRIENKLEKKEVEVFDEEELFDDSFPKTLVNSNSLFTCNLLEISDKEICFYEKEDTYTFDIFDVKRIQLKMLESTRQLKLNLENGRDIG